MTHAALPANEDARLAALHRYDLLDTPPEQVYDDVARLASQICGTPTALISLIDTDRQWFKARVGLDATETPREQAFCAHALLDADVFEVPDAVRDPRFSDNPLVTGDLGIRFYAGAPLVTEDGAALGTVCVIDRVPRHLSPEQRAALQSLSRLTISLLEARRGEQRQRLLFAANPEAMWVHDAETLALLDVNEAALNRYGYSRAELLRLTVSDLEVAPQSADGDGTCWQCSKDGRLSQVEIHSRPIEFGGRAAVLVCAKDVTAFREADRTLKSLLAQREQLMAAIPSVLVSVDEHGRITHWNGGAERMLGRPSDRMVGRPFTDCGIAWDCRRIGDAVRDCLDSGRSVRLDDVPYVCPDGGTGFLGLSLSPVHGLRGQSLGFLLQGADVTKRKQAEEALRQREADLQRSNSILRAQQEAIPDGLLVVDEQHRIVSYNHHFCEILRIPEAAVQPDEDDTLLNHALSLVAHPEEFLAKVRYLYDHPEESSHDELLLKDGRVLERFSGPTAGPDGHYYGRVWHFRDITQRRQDEERLMRSSVRIAEQALERDQLSRKIERLSLVATKTTNAVIITDAGGRIEWVNDSFTRITGYELTEVVGHKPGSFLQGPATDAATVVRLRAAIRAGHSFEGELYNYHKMGRGYYVALSLSPLYADDGTTLQGFIAIQTDVWTNRKRSEEETARLAAIVESSKDAIIGKTLDGTIVSWNRGAELLYGYTAAETIGRSVSLLIPEDCSDELPTILDSIRQGKAIEYYETVRMSKGGRAIDVALTISPVYDTQGRLVGAATIARDVTERTRMQRELVQARDAALAATRLKSEFLANMSHEIRTPMNGVIGMSDLLLGTALDPEQQEYARIVKHSADSLLTIINDVLDFSKIEAGKLTVETVDFSLRVLLEDVAALFNPKAAEKGQSLTCVLGPALAGPAGHLRGDPGRLRQVMTNLLGNAIKFTDQGGGVRMEASLLSEGAAQARWRLAVRDTGIGIPPERQEAIFESFTQADGSTTRRYGGTGLGLTISRQLVTLMDGQIGVESEVGQGSLFWVEITLDKQAPVTAETEAPASCGVPTAAAPATLRILLAEDNPINQKVARHLLQQAGVSADNLTVVTNGREALGALDAGPYDLVLMDIQMPEIDGLEATAAVREREHRQGGHLPIIAMTAHAMAGDRERCLAGGMDDYITKPLRAVELSALLARWGQALDLEETPMDLRGTAGSELDHSYLEELCGGDAGFERELLQEFLSTAPDMLTRCRLMLAMGDASGLGHWAHTLKSGARTVGALALARHCQSLENFGQSVRLPEAAAVLPLFEAEGARAEVAVRRRLAELIDSGGARVKEAA